jgi:hypothetical protein
MLTRCSNCNPFENFEKRQIAANNSFSVKEKDWLGVVDSNQDSQIQRLVRICKLLIHIALLSVLNT